MVSQANYRFTKGRTALRRQASTRFFKVQSIRYIYYSFYEGSPISSSSAVDSRQPCFCGMMCSFTAVGVVYMSRRLSQSDIVSWTTLTVPQWMGIYLVDTYGLQAAVAAFFGFQIEQSNDMLGRFSLRRRMR